MRDDVNRRPAGKVPPFAPRLDAINTMEIWSRWYRGLNTKSSPLLARAIAGTTRRDAMVWWTRGRMPAYATWRGTRRAGAKRLKRKVREERDAIQGLLDERVYILASFPDPCSRVPDFLQMASVCPLRRVLSSSSRFERCVSAWVISLTIMGWFLKFFFRKSDIAYFIKVVFFSI